MHLDFIRKDITVAHEVYKRMQEKRRKQSSVHYWKPVFRHLILEQCVVSGNAYWRAVMSDVLGRWLQATQHSTGFIGFS